MEINWNSIVGEEDIIFHLGDFAWKHINQISNQLTGRKILLKGSHDRSKPSVYQRANWKLIDDILIDIKNEFKIIALPKPSPYKLNSNCIIKDILDYRILFSHIPIVDDNLFDQKYQESRRVLQNLFENYKCDLNIHGHIHSKDAKGIMCFNVSVEKNEFKPIRLKEILANI
jgi:calcineurin-like phosphoesterase family protein